MKKVDTLNEKMKKVGKDLDQIHIDMLEGASKLNREEFNNLLRKYRNTITEYDKYYNEFIKLIEYIDKTI